MNLEVLETNFSSVASVASPESSVPVFRAALPCAAELLPYLERIDAARWYSNRGPLLEELEHRLGALLATTGSRLIAAASGTAALQAAILAAAGRATVERDCALIPGYTFVASAAAVEACGYRPVFVDIDPENWMLSPDTLLSHPLLPRAGVVMVVSPYGRPVAQAPWVQFREASGVPVVIDAAASFEALRRDPAGLTGHIPVALSLHATKPFSTGEGGIVIWQREKAEHVARALNFGILHRREVRAPGFNGKMSEFTAAVGLASLDRLGRDEGLRSQTIGAYVAAALRHGVHDALVLAPDIASTYVLFDAGSAQAAAHVAVELGMAGYEHRFWYGAGLHREPYYRRGPVEALPVVDDVAPRVIGLPAGHGLTLSLIDTIVQIAANARTKSLTRG